MCRYQDYEQIKRIAVKYYQDNNMCTVVALTAATGCSYGKAFNIYKKLGRKKRCGTYRDQQLKALDKLGYSLKDAPKYCKTLGKAEELLPSKGTYWLYTRGHVACVVDGKLYDWSKGRRHRVIDIYKVETV